MIRSILSGDPEVRWRLADVRLPREDMAEAEVHMQAAHFWFEAVLERHLLAFSDRGAEFYAGSGYDWRRALDLAQRQCGGTDRRCAP